MLIFLMYHILESRMYSNSNNNLVLYPYAKKYRHKNTRGNEMSTKIHTTQKKICNFCYYFVMVILLCYDLEYPSKIGFQLTAHNFLYFILFLSILLLSSSLRFLFPFLDSLISLKLISAACSFFFLFVPCKMLEKVELKRKDGQMTGEKVRRKTAESFTHPLFFEIKEMYLFQAIIPFSLVLNKLKKQ